MRIINGHESAWCRIAAAEENDQIRITALEGTD
jgi:hypothetical protein